MFARGSGNPQMDLNGMAPAANAVRLGDTIKDLVTQLNRVTAQLNALTALLGVGGSTVPNVTTGLAAFAAPVVVPDRMVSPQAPEITGDLP